MRPIPILAFTPLHLHSFASRSQTLAKSFNLASIDQAEGFILGQSELSAPSVLLTFDDGLREHLHIAREILEPLGLRGLFFVSSRPLQEGRALAVHKIHWLRATHATGRVSRDPYAADACRRSSRWMPPPRRLRGSLTLTTSPRTPS